MRNEEFRKFIITSLRTVVKQSDSENTDFEQYPRRLLRHFIPRNDDESIIQTMIFLDRA